MRRLSASPFLLFLCTSFFIFCFSSPLSTASDRLTQDSPLSDGDTIVSKNRYVGIWYNKVSVLTYIWVANRNDPIVGPTGTLSLVANGTLIITANVSTVVWSSSGSSTVRNPIAQILDNGNFVVKDVNDDSWQFFAWQSFDHLTDTFLPGMKLGWNLTSGLNRNIISWTSPTDPSPGPYTLSIDIKGDPQMFLWFGSTQIWRSRFSGIPEMNTYNMFKGQFVQNQDEVSAMASRLAIRWGCAIPMTCLSVAVCKGSYPSICQWHWVHLLDDAADYH